MKREPLANLVRDVRQVNPARLGRSHFIYLDISSIDNGSKRLLNPQCLSVDLAPSRARQLVEQEDVLVSTVRPNLNAVTLVPDGFSDAIASTGFCVMRAKREHLYPTYLFYFTQSAEFIGRLTKIATGASYPAVTENDILETCISLPELSEQRRIAEQLGQADRLRRTRRYALELTNTFLPAAFHELFGDLHRNERQWPFERLEENADIASGVAKGQKYADSPTLEVPYLRVANVQDGYLDLSEIKTIRVPLDDVEALRLQPGDIVMTEGGDFDKLGRGAIWPGGITDCIHQNHIFRVRLNQSKLLSTVFAAFLRNSFAKSYFLRCSKQTTNLASINMTQLRSTPIPLPPMLLQQKFAAIVERVERLRTVQSEALRQAEHLFSSLLDRAFTC